MNVGSTRQGDLPWNFLAPREKQILELIYQVCLETISTKNRQYLSQEKLSSQEDWLFYTDSEMPTHQRSRLRQMLFRASLTDEQINSTFEQLESKGLIERADCAGGISIRLTDWGYQVVEGEARGTIERVTFNQYELSESAWCLLACACAVPNHFVSIKTGESLIDLPAAGLSCKNVSPETIKSLTAFSFPLVEHYAGWIRSTKFGQTFYVDYYTHYSRRYPKTAAQPPTYSKAEIIQQLNKPEDLPTLVRLRRGEKSLGEAIADIKTKGITPAMLYQLEQRQLVISKMLSPTQLKAIYRWMEEV